MATGRIFSWYLFMVLNGKALCDGLAQGRTSRVSRGTPTHTGWGMVPCGTPKHTGWGMVYPGAHPTPGYIPPLLHVTLGVAHPALLRAGPAGSAQSRIKAGASDAPAECYSSGGVCSSRVLRQRWCILHLQQGRVFP